MNIKELAEQAGLQKHDFIYIAHELDIKRFAELVAAAEREACAKVCENLAKHPTTGVLHSWNCAAAIRARGDKHD